MAWSGAKVGRIWALRMDEGFGIGCKVFASLE